MDLYILDLYVMELYIVSVTEKNFVTVSYGINTVPAVDDL